MQKVEYIFESNVVDRNGEHIVDVLERKRRVDVTPLFDYQTYRVTEVATKDDGSQERVVVFRSAQCEQDEAEAKAAREVIGKADSMAWWRDSQTEYMVSSARDVAETLRRYADSIEREVERFEYNVVAHMAHADDPQMLKVAQRDAARLVQDVQGHALQAVNSANLPYMNQRAMDYVQGMTQWSEATREAYTQELPAS